VNRLLLVRHAPTAATRGGAFAADEAITEDGRFIAAALRQQLPAGGIVVSSPSLRCRQTAEASGLTPELEPSLTECDFGSWEGRTFAEIEANEPHLVGGWLSDPDAAPHGGESLTAFSVRVAGWLSTIVHSTAETVVAFTHAGVIKLAVVHALGAPLGAFWRLTAEPLSVTELRLDDGAWTLVRMNWTAPA
jgi:broad specificity phosphatase PhoE